MKRKITALFAAAVMILSFIPAVYAAEEMSLTVTADKTNVIAGDEIVFTVNIHNAVDLAKMQFTFNYDTDKLEYSKKTFGDALAKSSTKNVKPIPEQGKLGFTATLNEAFNGDGELCSFVFMVKDDAAAGVLGYSLTGMKFGSADESASEYDYFDSENSTVITIAEIYDYTIDSAVVEGEKMTLGFEIRKPAPKAMLILAFYDENRFIGMKSIDMSGFFGVFNVMVDISEFYDRFITVKGFLIEDYDTLRPLGRMIKVNKG